MYSKIQITGVLEVVTGMHIGGSSAFSAIGAVDSPVIKDVITNKPMIPGSSLKGKMRTLLSKKYNPIVQAKPDDDAECITRVFGSAKKNNGKVLPSKLLISDMFVINEEEIRGRDLQNLTEVKFENSINRATAMADLRQIERAVKGLKFGIDMIYEVENGKEDKIEEDIRLIADAMQMLQYDYLGGSGSRGYGKVKFYGLNADNVIGEVDNSIMENVNKLLHEI